MKIKKEITVAVIIGLIIGLLVVGGILRARSAINNMKTPGDDTKTPTSSQTPASNEGNGELFLSLITEDNQVVNTPTITVTGKTLPTTYVVLNSEKGDFIIVPNDLGTFSQEVTLVKGANTIVVTVYEENGNKKEQTLTTVYTSAEI
ncbi:MAG: hypothetical protein ABII80_03395 [bacterium]